MRKAIRHGDLFYADLNQVVGSEQGCIRPVLVIQNDLGDHFSPTIVAAAITSRQVKNSLPTHILLENMPAHTSMLLCDWFYRKRQNNVDKLDSFHHSQ